MRLALLIITVLLIPFNFGICELAQRCYSFDLASWWKLRLNIYALQIYLIFQIQKLKVVESHKKYYNFVLSIGIGLTASDVIDRWVLDNRIFTQTDVLAVAAVLIISYKNNLCLHKK